MTDQLQTPCPDDTLNELIAVASADDERGLAKLATLIAVHGNDARLHFLQGSLLAGLRRYPQAHAAMAEAVRIAPDYAIARFQLGLLELSSGEAAAADTTLLPLSEDPNGGALAVFARSLRHLARDEFDQAADLIGRGMANNPEHPLVNRDMELILARIRELRAESAPPESMSAAHMLLRQDAKKSTRH